jgi:UDP-N-acetylmuramoyl-L-alanyl-D-glutamate--2,6-diaminopimelate ligase
VTAEPSAASPSRLRDLALLVGAELVAGPAGAGGREGAPEDVGVVDVHHDSRQVVPGSLFACIAGASSDGHDHAGAAIAAGAVALVTERPLALGVPELRVANTRAAVGPLAAAVHGRPAESLDVVAVTGTNGKTTVTHLVDAIAVAAGRASATIGTLSGTRTTPEATDLQRQLASLVRDGVSTVAIEVSSHALDMRRVDGMVAAVAVFTNLSRDHLDHHGTMDAYFQAKARLFEPSLARAAVVNLDDTHGRLLADAAVVPTTGVSLADAKDLVVRRDHSTFTWQGHDIRLGLPGRFNVSNALLAAAAARAIGIEPAAIARGLEAARSVRGRFERVELGAPFDVVVDFAHTPDALEHVLGDARDMADRVIVVVGCGGDKDRGKRPAMGEVASRLGHVVVVTSDNPRTESPEAIIAEILEGIGGRDHVQVEPDRRRAIALALEAARPGDLVVVAGKGHETEQIIGDERVPFDDRSVVLEEYRRLLGSGS